jgi:sodium transport system permease protein
MDIPGSASRDVPPARAVLAVIAGACGLLMGGVLAQVLRQLGLPVGLRTALVMSQLLLALPAAVVLGRARALVPGPLGAVPSIFSAWAGACLWLTSLGVLGLQSWFLPPDEAHLELFRRIHAQLRPETALGWLGSLAAVAVAPGICEELVFRGVLLTSLLRYGRPAALLGSSAAFGLMHVDFTGAGAAFVRVPFALLVGLGLGAIRLRSGTLVAPAIAHAVLNALTFTVVVFASAETLGGPVPGVAAAPAWATSLGLLVLGATLTRSAVRAIRPRATLPT